MKVEFLYHYRKRHGLTLKDRLVAYLPRYAPHCFPLRAARECGAERGPGRAAALRPSVSAMARDAFREAEMRVDGTPHPSSRGENARGTGHSRERTDDQSY